MLIAPYSFHLQATPNNKAWYQSTNLRRNESKDQLHFSGKESAQAMASAVRTGNLVKVESLLSSLETIDTPLDDENNTALHLSAQHGQQGLLKFLLKKGSSVTALNKNNDTALSLAAGRGHLPIIKILLQHPQPAPNLRQQLKKVNSKGLTPDQIAKQHGHQDIAHLIQEKHESLGPEPAILATSSVSSSPLQILKQYYQEKRPLSQYSGELEPLLTDESADYMALRIQDDLAEEDPRSELLTKIKLAAQYQQDAPTCARQFWDHVCQTAIGKKVTEFLHPRKKGFDEVAGMDDVKRELRSKFLVPHQSKINPFAFAKPDGSLPYAKATPVYGLLLHGLRGTGKSHIAKKLVEELEQPHIYLKYSDVSSKMHGETERAITQAFAKAAERNPSFIIVDEVDSFLVAKDKGSDISQKIVNTFMTESEQAPAKGVCLIGTTNKIQEMESAGVREGRFDVCIDVPPPDKKARLALFNMYLPAATPDGKLPFSDEDRELFAENTRAYSAPRIQKLCYNLGNKALGRHEDISPELLLEMIQQIGPSYTSDEMEPYAHID